MNEFFELKNEKLVIDDRYFETVTVPDCFVAPANKLGRGHGEAKLYMGSKEMMRNFFGGSGFKADCFLLKKDLVTFLEAIKKEYDHPMFDYQKKEDLSKLWKERSKDVAGSDDIISFTVEDQTQIEGDRGYVKSKDKGFKLIRQLSLPLVSCLSVIRLRKATEKYKFYWKLFVDYDYFEDKANALVFNYGGKKNKGKNRRLGQDKFRRAILNECPQCPITHVSDTALLMASHIKPWRVSSNVEKTDPKNGFILSPLYDKLFDKGFITFSDEKELVISQWLSPDAKTKLELNKIKKVSDLPLDDERKQYLDYHRKFVFRG